MISLDSPLRHLPQNLNRRQLLYLDGVRIAIEMCDIAYTRLSDTLLAITATENLPKAERAPMLISAVQDAWSAIDSVHRLRRLLKSLPRLKQKLPWLQGFYRATESIDDLRNVVQHLDSEMETMIDANAPLWGRLTWIRVVDAETSTLESCSLVLGSFFDRMDRITNPTDRPIRSLIDQVDLHSSGHTACLTEAWRSLPNLVERIEKGLRAAPQNLDGGSDALMIVGMRIESGPGQDLGEQNGGSPG
jgi:hypothetical protein